MKHTLINLLLLVFVNQTFAQNSPQIEKCKCGITSFKDDSVQSFTNLFVLDNIISPITKSKAIVEFRLFPSGNVHGSGSIYVISCFGDSIAVTEVSYAYKVKSEEFDSLREPDFHIVHKNDSGDYVIRGFLERRVKISWDSVMTAFSKNNAFALKDYNQIISELKSANIKYVDPAKSGPPPKDFFANNILEIKFGNHFRNILINFPISIYNTGIPYFRNASNIVRIFHSVFDNLKIPSL